MCACESVTVCVTVCVCVCEYTCMCVYNMVEIYVHGVLALTVMFSLMQCERERERGREIVSVYWRMSR